MANGMSRLVRGIIVTASLLQGGGESCLNLCIMHRVEIYFKDC